LLCATIPLVFLSKAEKNAKAILEILEREIAAILTITGEPAQQG